MKKRLATTIFIEYAYNYLCHFSNDQLSKVIKEIVDNKNHDLHSLILELETYLNRPVNSKIQHDQQLDKCLKSFYSSDRNQMIRVKVLLWNLTPQGVSKCDFKDLFSLYYLPESLFLDKEFIKSFVLYDKSLSQLTILKTDMLLNISNVMRTEILSEIETYNAQRDALLTDSDISDDEIENDSDSGVVCLGNLQQQNKKSRKEILFDLRYLKKSRFSDDILHKWLTKDFKHDREVVAAILKYNNNLISDVSSDLLQDKNFVIPMTECLGFRIYDRLPEILKLDIKVVSIMFRFNTNKVYFQLPEHLKRNSTIISAALRCKGMYIRRMDCSIRGNKHYVEIAMRSNVASLNYADLDLRCDFDFMLKMCKIKCKAIRYSGKKLMVNKDFVLELFNYHTTKTAREYLYHGLSKEGREAFKSLFKEFI